MPGSSSHRPGARHLRGLVTYGLLFFKCQVSLQRLWALGFRNWSTGSASASTWQGAWRMRQGTSWAASDVVKAHRNNPRPLASATTVCKVGMKKTVITGMSVIAAASIKMIHKDRRPQMHDGGEASDTSENMAYVCQNQKAWNNTVPRGDNCTPKPLPVYVSYSKCQCLNLTLFLESSYTCGVSLVTLVRIYVRPVRSSGHSSCE